MNSNLRHNILLVLGAALLAAPLLGLAAEPGAPPQMVMTWHAFDYVPPGFEGKIFPIAGSKIRASFELLENGVPVDTSKETVRWYFGDKVMPGALGHSVTIALPEIVGDSAYFKVELPNHNGQFLSQSLTVPVVRPEAVIEWPYPSNEFAVTSFQVRAIPYFFNVSDPSHLAYTWRVNDTQPTAALQPDTLDISLSSIPARGTPLNVSLLLQNPSSILERANSDLRLMYASQ